MMINAYETSGTSPAVVNYEPLLNDTALTCCVMDSRLMRFPHSPDANGQDSTHCATAKA
jgi:hypothetical protein